MARKDGDGSYYKLMNQLFSFKEYNTASVKLEGFQSYDLKHPVLMFLLLSGFYDKGIILNRHINAGYHLSMTADGGRNFQLIMYYNPIFNYRRPDNKGLGFSVRSVVK